MDYTDIANIRSKVHRGANISNRIFRPCIPMNKKAYSLPSPTATDNPVASLLYYNNNTFKCVSLGYSSVNAI